MNLNKLARDIALREGGKQNQSIAQVKETLRIALESLAAMDPVDALILLRRVRTRKSK